MNDITDALDRLADAIDAEEHPEDLGLWAVAALCHRRRITFALSSAHDPTDALRELGEEWAANVVELLDEQPDAQAATLRMVWAVVQKLVDDVRRRGLTKDQRGPLRA